MEVVDNPDKSRYELRVDGRVAGFIQYRRTPDAIDLIHTEVEPEFEGQGLGSVLAEGALEDLRARGVHAIATCPFIATYRKRHPEYADVFATS
jgi:predicted GNAT family acetyltransferase